MVLTLVLYLFAKFTISASFLIIYPFAGELYPTQLRGVGIGASAYISGLGLIVIPFIVYLVRKTAGIFFLTHAFSGNGNARFASGGDGSDISNWRIGGVETA